MGFIDLQKTDGIATVTLSRGKVNALNGAVVDQLRGVLKALETDAEVRSLVLTGAGKFFSFGFDIPEFLSFSREQFAEYIRNFTDLSAYLFLYPKPVLAALNGHTIAGGCILALACDYRIIMGGKAKIGLNEMSFGSSLFATAVEMLRFWTGSANATAVLVAGSMYPAEDAQRLGLVHEVAPEGEFMDRTRKVAAESATKAPRAFAHVKSLLRSGVIEEARRREGEGIKEFIDIWYSDATMAKLREIKIN